MKFSTQEEYGMRCLIMVAVGDPTRPTTIPEISEREGLTATNVAKLLNILRRAGFIESLRGQNGGYVLSRPAEKILIRDVLDALGGTLYDDSFCGKHSGFHPICAHDATCTVRGLWQKIQTAVDQAVGEMTLADLVGPFVLSFSSRLSGMVKVGQAGQP